MINWGGLRDIVMLQLLHLLHLLHLLLLTLLLPQLAFLLRHKPRGQCLLSLLQLFPCLFSLLAMLLELERLLLVRL